jgi:trans-aconitate 2-methyltransferase
VGDGGALAVQMPAQFDSAIHRLIAGIASREAWRNATEVALRSVFVGNPSFYYDLLMPRSRRLVLWLTEYTHIMAGAQAILDWVRATALRNILDALKNEEQRIQFEAEVLEQIADDYPPQADGRVLFRSAEYFSSHTVDEHSIDSHRSQAIIDFVSKERDLLCAASEEYTVKKE